MSVFSLFSGRLWLWHGVEQTCGPSGLSVRSQLYAGERVADVWILSRSVTELYSDCWWLLEESWWLMCRWGGQNSRNRLVWTRCCCEDTIGELWAAWFICSPCFSDFLPEFGEMNVNAAEAVITQHRSGTGPERVWDVVQFLLRVFVITGLVLLWSPGLVWGQREDTHAQSIHLSLLNI